MSSGLTLDGERWGDIPILSPKGPVQQTLFAQEESPHGPQVGLVDMGFGAPTEPTSRYGERTIRELRGVIHRVDESTVTVYLRDNDVSVDFPRQLFRGAESLLRYGQSVTYAIRQRETGHRYQCFLPAVDNEPNPFRQRVYETLAAIRPRE